jgi:hypothetical protein
MQPTTDGSSCHFLEPTHAVHLEVNISKFYRPDDYGDDADLYRNRKKIDVAGHPAIYFESGSGRTRSSYHIYASPGSDTAASGFVNILLDLSPPRGTPSGPPSSPGESHPRALTEPYVSLSARTALVALVTRQWGRG